MHIQVGTQLYMSPEVHPLPLILTLTLPSALSTTTTLILAP